MEIDAFSLENEILRLVGERNKICLQLLEKIKEDTKTGRISPEEALAMHEQTMKELEITEGIIRRQEQRLKAAKK